MILRTIGQRCAARDKNQRWFLAMAILAALSCLGGCAGDDHVATAAKEVEDKFRSATDSASELEAYERLLALTNDNTSVSYVVILYGNEPDKRITNTDAFDRIRSGDRSRVVVVEIKIIRDYWLRQPATILVFKHQLIAEDTLVALLCE
jgi:hypothetical protein